MSKKELNQIYYLNKEIEMWKKELAGIEYKYDSALQSPNWKSTGGGINVSDKTADTVENIEKNKNRIKTIIEEKLSEIQTQRFNIITYINSIDDSLIRQIMYYRHVSCMSWVKVARYVGGKATPDSVRMAHDNYLKNI